MKKVLICGIEMTLEDLDNWLQEHTHEAISPQVAVDLLRVVRKQNKLIKELKIGLNNIKFNP